jgi:hypothetical protein
MRDTAKPTPEPVTIHVSTPTGPRDEVLPVVIPSDYALLEELLLASLDADDDPVKNARIGAAMLAACCPALGRKAARAGHDYGKSGYSPLAYGRAVYSWLHGQGVPVSDIVAAREYLRPLLAAAAWPTPDEVADELGKSPGRGAS